MKNNLILALALTILGWSAVMAQPGQRKIPLNSLDGLLPVKAEVSAENYLGKPCIRVVDSGMSTNGLEVARAQIKDLRFHNGSIELELAAKPLSTAGELARGFVGIAFRIADDESRFECIYLRPANGRAEEQVRRNHSVQYYSYPDYPWYRSRKETPGKYESYVDLVAGEWTKVRIEVQGDKARLYVNGATHPTLIVNDLKHGPDLAGALGLWIGYGTDAHFANLVVTPKD
ncbi:hypothetical protein [Chitinophaga japonensis]|uniref:3-keto-disaccharide hydrolase domain-containing protein n=1 Tax=Chitinophaga japonensis TaxID=104662 RepID=A0A562SZY9_CHIJA|nr:hypothetical protein [Chitinophaga japonensis]TWI86847.1 hypothetical protein LX66_4112 [Chitinophaga japonensis]